MNRIVTLLTLIVVFALALIGCAAPPTATPRPTAPPTPTVSPQGVLLAGAKQEGALDTYGSWNELEGKQIIEKFRAKYPFLKVNFFRAASGDVVTKVLAEAKAGTAPPDVIQLDAIDMLELYNQKLLAAYKSPEAEAYPDSAKHPWGYYAAAYINGIAIAYNTKLVKPEEAPKSWEDLLNPKWSGKMALEAEDWALIPFSAKVMGDDASNAFWTKLSNQNPKVMKGHTEVANAVAKGDVALSPTVYIYRVEALKKKGESIDWVRTDPVYSYLNSIAVTAKAPHPNAARLFVDWLLSAEGQAEVAAVGLIPIRQGVKANPPSMTEGVRFYYGDPMLIAASQLSASQYHKLFPLK